MNNVWTCRFAAALIESNPFLIDVPMHAIQPGPKVIVSLFRNRKKIDRHPQAFEYLRRNNIESFRLRHIQNDRKIEVAIRPMLPAHTRTKGDNRQRLDGCDEATHRFLHLLLGHIPVGLDQNTHPALARRLQKCCG